MFYMSHLLNGKVTVNGLQCFQQSDVRWDGDWDFGSIMLVVW